MNVEIYKAQVIGKREPIEDLVIWARHTIPDAKAATGRVETMHADAVNLVYALRQTVPQGTWAQIVAEVARTWTADQAGIISASSWAARE